MNDMMALALSVANILAGSIVAIIDFRYWKKNPKEPWRWIKFVYAIIGAYWATVYLYIFLAAIGAVPSIDNVLLGKVFIRPALTVTLSAIAGGAIIRMRRT